MPVMGKTTTLVGSVLSGVGVAAIGYCTYKYFQSKNCHWETVSSTTGSFYTLQEFPSDTEYESAVEELLDTTQEDLLYERVDKLVEGDETGIEEAYSVMEKYVEIMSEYPNFLWRFAKVHHLRGKVEKPKAKELNGEGLKYAEKAVSGDPKNPEAHKWFAILKGREAEFLNDKLKKADNAKIFLEHVKKALELKHNDWELHHLLGMFEYELANLTFVEKLFVRSVFQGAAKCDYSVARKHFSNAEKFNPKSSKQTKLFLAKCFFAEKEFEKALKCLTESLEMTVKSVDDKACHKEAQELKYDYTKKV